MYNLKKSNNLEKKSKRLKIEPIFKSMIEEMEILGYRNRTIFDYCYHFNKFIKRNKIKYIDELNTHCLINYLDQSNISQSTKRIRLKTIRATLNRLYDKGYIKEKFWTDIKVKVDNEVKEGITLNELNYLLAQLDLNTFTHFRDATLLILLWETGVRIETATNLKLDDIDQNNLVINFRGNTMKNGKHLTLPISKTLSEMLIKLYEVNNEIFNGSDWLFMTEQANRLTNNAFGKRVSIYKRRYNLKNINPHAIRRGFAKRLLNQGVSIPVISKVLNHSSLQATTQYLHISNQEAIEVLRELDSK